MALDKVQPLKLEDSTTGGTEIDQFPTGLDPQEDFVEAAGLVIDDAAHRDEKTIIWRDADDMKFKDGNNPSGYTLTELAESAGGGITEGQHENLDTLVHWVNQTSHEEVTRIGDFITKITVWNSPAKTTKIREEIVTRAGLLNRISQVVAKQYDRVTGVLKSTMTEIYTRAPGGMVASIARTRTP
jgi:hypothetical protein